MLTQEVEQEVQVQEEKAYKQLFAVYGTLRVGEYNNSWLGDAQYLGTMKTPANYTMYSMGGFPGVAEGGKTTIVVDIFGTNSDRVINSVCSLEGYISRDHPRNWYNTCDVETPFGIAEMFTQNVLQGGTRGIITSGDWKKR